ncbi:phosphate ABC transporter permease PstA [Streptomyces sp. NPDC051940]|uniref:phosphate ABC transporter permease PstA n=1 Tax=Streptomyces sp. NPDC051940 TaxID=3155675 RepID=UPI003434244B
MSETTVREAVTGAPDAATTVRTEPARRGTDQDGPRRSTRSLHRSDVLALAGAAVTAVSLTVLISLRVAPFDAPLGFGVLAYGLFVLAYAALVSMDGNRVTVRDRVAAVIWHSLAVLLLVALVFVVVYTMWHGRQVLPRGNFYTEDMSTTGPQQPLSSGGVLHAAAGTLIQISMALSLTVPLGLACAVFLNEVPGPYARFVRTIVEAMTALPSIVAGLFVYATVIVLLDFEKSGFAASLAISVMMLPIIIRASDVVLRLVPGSLREASYALGAGQWRTVWTVILPTARSGLTTAVILGTARGVGETSPVLLTSGMAHDLNLNPFEGPMVSLPLDTFWLVGQPQESYVIRGFGAAAVLLGLVLTLFVVARLIGGRGPGELGRRALRRRARRSHRDALRISARRRAAGPPG